jgi:hypothetical protein
MMTMTYSIKIFDVKGNLIGELPTASADDIVKYINKGFIVKDINTGKDLTIADVTSSIGVSDGFIQMG